MVGFTNCDNESLGRQITEHNPAVSGSSTGGRVPGQRRRSPTWPPTAQSRMASAARHAPRFHRSGPAIYGLGGAAEIVELPLFMSARPRQLSLLTSTTLTASARFRRYHRRANTRIFMLIYTFLQIKPLPGVSNPFMAPTVRVYFACADFKCRRRIRVFQASRPIHPAVQACLAERIHLIAVLLAICLRTGLALQVHGPTRNRGSLPPAQQLVDILNLNTSWVTAHSYAVVIENYPHSSG